MEYTKIKVTSQDDAKRFNRTIAITGDPDLYRLGVIIGLSVKAWFEHCWLFETQNPRITYLFDDWDDYGFYSSKKLSESHLSDLGEKFTYEYDTGESYDFDCKILKSKFIIKENQVEDNTYPEALVIKGKGQGIFENDHMTLWKLFDGKLDPESTGNEEEMDYLPMNMHFEKFGDFDNPIDLDEFVYYKEEIDSLIEEMGLLNKD